MFSLFFFTRKRPFERYGMRMFLMGMMIFGSVFFATDAFAAMLEMDVQTTYRDILDREPTATELADAKAQFVDRAALARFLNDLPERDDTIRRIYERALKRTPRPHELFALKQGVAPTNRIRTQLFESEERRLAIVDLYLGILGRYPRDSALDFYRQTRSPFDRIRRVLSESEERRLAIIQKFTLRLGRLPSDAELTFFINSGRYLDFIGKNNRPVADAGFPQEVSNDTLAIELDGSKSYDLEGDALTYQWELVRSPDPLSVSSPSSFDSMNVRPVFILPLHADDPLYRYDGVYRFQLTVSDGQLVSDPDFVEIRVLPETAFEQLMLQQVNAARSAENATSTPSLALNAVLNRVARKYSRYLFVNDWLEHVDRDGKTPADRVEREGYTFVRIGENVALMSSKVPMRITLRRVQTIFDGWLASEEHRKNMVNPEYSETGIGFFGGQFSPQEYRIYATQIFAVPKKEEPSPQPPSSSESP